MVVNNKIELETKFLKDYPNWNFLAEEELNRKTIEIYNDMNKYQLNVTNLISKYFKKEKVELTDGDEAYRILEMLNNLKIELENE